MGRAAPFWSQFGVCCGHAAPFWPLFGVCCGAAVQRRSGRCLTLFGVVVGRSGDFGLIGKKLTSVNPTSNDVVPSGRMLPQPILTLSSDPHVLASAQFELESDMCFTYLRPVSEGLSIFLTSVVERLSLTQSDSDACLRESPKRVLEESSKKEVVPSAKTTLRKGLTKQDAPRRNKVFIGSDWTTRNDYTDFLLTANMSERRISSYYCYGRPRLRTESTTRTLREKRRELLPVIRSPILWVHL